MVFPYMKKNVLKKGEIKTGSDSEASMRKGAINYDIIKNNRSLPQFITERKKNGELEPHTKKCEQIGSKQCRP